MTAPKRYGINVDCPRCGALAGDKCWKIDRPGRPVTEGGRTAEIHLSRIRKTNGTDVSATKLAKVPVTNIRKELDAAVERIKELEARVERLEKSRGEESNLRPSG